MISPEHIVNNDRGQIEQHARNSVGVLFAFLGLAGHDGVEKNTGIWKDAAHLGLWSNSASVWHACLANIWILVAVVTAVWLAELVVLTHKRLRWMLQVVPKCGHQSICDLLLHEAIRQLSGNSDHTLHKILFVVHRLPQSRELYSLHQTCDIVDILAWNVSNDLVHVLPKGILFRLRQLATVTCLGRKRSLGCLEQSSKLPHRLKYSTFCLLKHGTLFRLWRILLCGLLVDYSIRCWCRLLGGSIRLRWCRAISLYPRALCCRPFGRSMRSNPIQQGIHDWSVDCG